MVGRDPRPSGDMIDPRNFERSTKKSGAKFLLFFVKFLLFFARITAYQPSMLSKLEPTLE